MRPATAGSRRGPSPESDSSALSTITAADPSRTVQAPDSLTASSTPPTSHDDTVSVRSDAMKSAAALDADAPRRLSSRRRQLVATYNDKENAGTRIHTPTKYVNGTYIRKHAARELPATTRLADIASADAVNDQTENLADTTSEAVGLESEADQVADGGQEESATLVRRKSTRVADTAAGLLATTVEAPSSFGRRARDAVQLATGSLHASREPLRPRDAVTRARDGTELVSKRSRLGISDVQGPSESSSAPAASSHRSIQPTRKQWLEAGKFWRTGQGEAPVQRVDKLNHRSTREKGPEFFFPLPMFTMARVLDLNAPKRVPEARRPFTEFQLPFSVFSPLPRPVRISKDEWNPLKKNEYRGEDAVELRQKARKERKDLAKHEEMKCRCGGFCDNQCFNRCTNIECNSMNCIVGPECGNRAFADLETRVKSRAQTDMGRLYDLGVEVMETKDRGRGVRAMRAFERDQVIMEYIGEIITQTESDRRVKNDYKDHRCFYLMTFHQKLIIDGYRGNVARFVNHSCEPNCRMEKWMVNGDLRMALFANRFIMTGEELTWNYSFESYGKEQECLCGATTCRGVIGRRPQKGYQKEKDTDGPSTGSKRGLRPEHNEDNPVTKRQKVSSIVKSVSKKSKLVAAKTKNGVMGLMHPKAAASKLASMVQDASRTERAARRISAGPRTPATQSNGRAQRSAQRESLWAETQPAPSEVPDEAQQPKRATRSFAQTLAATPADDQILPLLSGSEGSDNGMSLRRFNRKKSAKTSPVPMGDPSGEDLPVPNQVRGTRSRASIREASGDRQSGASRLAEGPEPKKTQSTKSDGPATRRLTKTSVESLRERARESALKQSTLSFGTQGLTFASPKEQLSADTRLPTTKNKPDRLTRTSSASVSRSLPPT